MKKVEWSWTKMNEKLIYFWTSIRKRQIYPTPGRETGNVVWAQEILVFASTIREQFLVLWPRRRFAEFGGAPSNREWAESLCRNKNGETRRQPFKTLFSLLSKIFCFIRHWYSFSFLDDKLKLLQRKKVRVCWRCWWSGWLRFSCLASSYRAHWLCLVSRGRSGSRSTIFRQRRTRMPPCRRRKHDVFRWKQSSRKRDMSRKDNRDKWNWWNIPCPKGVWWKRRRLHTSTKGSRLPKVVPDPQREKVIQPHLQCPWRKSRMHLPLLQKPAFKPMKNCEKPCSPTQTGTPPFPKHMAILPIGVWDKLQISTLFSQE